MSAEIVAFPLVRRHAFIRRHAAIMASLSLDAADRHLALQLRVQCSALLRKGVRPEAVEAQRNDLLTALRTELARLAFANGGVA